MKPVNAQILREYDEKCRYLEEFNEKITELIIDLLQVNKIKVHSINHRIKTKESMIGKIEKTDLEYNKLDDVLDICGVRIITYFVDDVSRVSKIIEREFDIDWDNSTDKGKLLDPDRFGYRSVHYLVSLNKKRLKLAEYHRFSGCKVEIQIRSILQHAWAEMEHDLGYKSKLSVPKDIRRQFSRLAGLLELADDEFIDIRKNLTRYEKSISEIIKKSPEHVLIDKVSLSSYIAKSDLVREIDEGVMKVYSATELEFKTDYIGNLVNTYLYFGDKDVSQLESELLSYKDDIPKLAKHVGARHGKSTYKTLSAGISIFYLCYLLALKDKSKTKVLDYIENRKLQNSNKDAAMGAKDFAEYLMRFNKRKDV
jgi:ppGpp synthetase/RelA/SpoT-type nucleotidyltranferase